jgi:tetratricopeptide (TPR) repeat protein
LGNIGAAYAALKQFHRAAQLYEIEIDIARRIGERSSEGLSLRNMSLVLYDLGRRSQAIDCAERALEIFRQIEHPYTADLCKILAEWYTLESLTTSSLQ